MIILTKAPPTSGTETVKTQRKPLGPKLFVGRNQVENATQLKTQTISCIKDSYLRALIQEPRRWI